LRGEETKVDFVPKNPKSFSEEFNSDEELIYSEEDNEENSGDDSMISDEGGVQVKDTLTSRLP
jgi:hypothetical protein